jgi:tight adherence protein B
MTSWRSRLLTVVAGTALAGSLSAGLATPALADDASPVGRLDHVQNAGDQVQALFSVPGLPSGVSPDPDSVQVTFNGAPIDATAENVDAGTVVKRTSILTIDVSQSMAGPRFAAAKQAALAYIDATPSDVYIGLVTFASSVQTVQAPTQDHGALRSAIAGLTLSRQTLLYDGVMRGLAAAGTEGSRSMLLLSDGNNTGGTASEAAVIRAAKKADVRIDAVGLNQELTPASPLSQIAHATDGTVTSTSDFDKLRALFAAEASDLAKQIVVTFTPPAGMDASEGTLDVSVEAAGVRYGDNAFVTLPKAPVSTKPVYLPSDNGRTFSSTWLLGGIGLLFVGLAVLLGFGITSLRPNAATPMQQQLSLYTVHGMKRTQPAPQQGDGVDLKGAAVQLADRMVMPDLEDKVAKKLEAGGLKLKPAEWLLLHGGIAIGAPLLSALLFGPNPIVIGLFLLLGAVLPFFYLSFKASRRIKNFNSGLAETLQIIAGGLQAGLSLSQAIDTVVREGVEPISGEFQKAIVEQRLGVEIEDSLEAVAERMESIDFKWVVMAIRIQREVGGNLAELLLNVSATLREREYLRRQVSVLSAEGRLSAWILGALPPFFVVYLTLTRPTYVAPMYHTHLGWILCAMGITSMSIGAFWLKKAVKVEV